MEVGFYYMLAIIDCNIEYMITNPAAANNKPSLHQLPLSIRNLRDNVDASLGSEPCPQVSKTLLEFS
jgi:hypothetical protein